MKPLFLVLVLLNLAYLAWQTWIVPSKAPPALAEAEGVPRLVLVGERPGDPGFTLPVDTAVEEIKAVSLPPRDSVAATDEEPPVALPAETAEAASAATPDGADATADPTPVEIEVAVAPPAALRCVSLGPFLNLREATEATAMLIESGLQPSQRLAESQVWFGHWVHLPPQASRAAAVAIVEDLRAKGVSDIYIEPSGPLRNSISLGVFSEREHAETRAGRIRKLGISPQIRDRYRDSSVYWVDFAIPEDRAIDPGLYQASPRRVLRIEPRDCPADAEG